MSSQSSFVILDLIQNPVIIVILSVAKDLFPSSCLPAEAYSAGEGIMKGPFLSFCHSGLDPESRVNAATLDSKLNLE